jgi:hypothetical protein
MKLLLNADSAVTEGKEQVLGRGKHQTYPYACLTVKRAKRLQTPVQALALDGCMCFGSPSAEA